LKNTTGQRLSERPVSQTVGWPARSRCDVHLDNGRSADRQLSIK